MIYFLNNIDQTSNCLTNNIYIFNLKNVNATGRSMDSLSF